MFISYWGNSQDFPNYLNANTVTTIAYWELGEERKYHVTASQEIAKGTKSKTAKNDVSYDISLNVVQQADSFYVIDLVYSNYNIPTELKAMELMEELIEISEGIKIRYKINELGQFVTILNKVELIKTLKNQMKILKGKLQTVYPDNEDVKKMLTSAFESFEQTYLKVENVDALYSQDLLAIHGMYGFELKLNESVDLEMDYMVMNDIEVGGEAKLKVNSINKSTDSFHFSIVERPNKEQMSGYLNQIVSVLADAAPKEKLNISNFEYDIKTTTKYVMELSTGWLKSINIVQNIEGTFENETSKMTKKRSIIAF